MGVKLGCSHCGRNLDWRCLSIGSWGEYLGLRGRMWQENGENYTMRSLMIWTYHQILFGSSNREEWSRRGMQHVWGKVEVYTEFWWVNLDRRRTFGRPRRRWEDNIKIHLQEVGCEGMDWIDLAQVRDRWRTLMNEKWNVGFHKMRDANRLASQEGLCSMD